MIIGVSFGDSDADNWKPEGMYKLLDWKKKNKKYKHGKACYDQQKQFSPSVLSVDGMMVKDALV